MPFLYKSACFPHQCFAFAQQALTTRTVFHDAAASSLQARRCELLCENAKLPANRCLEGNSWQKTARGVLQKTMHATFLHCPGSWRWLPSCRHAARMHLASGLHVAVMWLPSRLRWARMRLASRLHLDCHAPRIQLARRSHPICIQLSADWHAARTDLASSPGPDDTLPSSSLPPAHIQLASCLHPACRRVPCSSHARRIQFPFGSHLTGGHSARIQLARAAGT